MDRRTDSISCRYTTSGNNYIQFDDYADASWSGQYRHRTVRQTNNLPPYIRRRNEFYYTPDAHSSNYLARHSVKPVYDFNAFITQDKIDCLVRHSARYGDCYDGKKHSQFATLIKQYTSASNRSLNHREQRQLIPLLYDFKVTPGWTWRSLTTTLHSFTAAGVLTPNKYMDERSKQTQAALLSTLLDAVILKCNQEPEARDIDAQGIANLLWAFVKLVDNGLKLEKTPKLKEVVAALLPHVKTKAVSKEEKDHFKPQEVTTLLWALVKLVDNGLELKKTPKLKEAVAALLPHMKTKAESKEEKDHFKPQEVATLLWALAKLVSIGLDLRKTAQLKEVVAALLLYVKTKAKSKEEKDHFSINFIVSLSWAVAKLGEAVELNLVQFTFDFLVDRISESPQLSQKEILMSLWAVMAFCARLYLYYGKDSKNSLEKHIGELFTRLENTSTSNPEDQSVIAMAASWLGKACPTIPHYRTTISQSQSTFRGHLQSCFPSLKIEEEKSLNSLPPVDLLLPDYNIIIDVQGPSHYVDGDLKIRNGSTLLKIALLQKSGFEVIATPVYMLDNEDSMKIVIDQIKTRLGGS